jgi:hypothetical protein
MVTLACTFIQTHSKPLTVKVRVYIKNMGFLNVLKRWQNIVHLLLLTVTDNVLNTLIQELGSHNESVSFSIISNEVETIP